MEACAIANSEHPHMGNYGNESTDYYQLAFGDQRANKNQIASK